MPALYDRVDEILALMKRFKVPIKMSTIVTILRFWIAKAHDIYDPAKEKNEDDEVLSLSMRM